MTKNAANKVEVKALVVGAKTYVHTTSSFQAKSTNRTVNRIWTIGSKQDRSSAKILICADYLQLEWRHWRHLTENTKSTNSYRFFLDFFAVPTDAASKIKCYDTCVNWEVRTTSNSVNTLSHPATGNLHHINHISLHGELSSKI